MQKTIEAAADPSQQGVRPVPRRAPGPERAALRVALLLLLAGLLVGGVAGCEVGPRSGLGLRLPEGDIARGEQAFSDLGCVECHVVDSGRGGAFARVRSDDGQVVVVLGGKADHITTHGELFTAIVNPSHGFPRRYSKEDVFEGERSKMPALNEQMTVAQLIDLTEYLQSQYELDPQLLYGP